MNNLVKIDKLGDSNLHYNRDSIEAIKTKGRPYSYYIDQDFLENNLKPFYNEFISFNPYGTPEIITSAGMFVNGNKGYHGKGKAMDIDGFFFQVGNYTKDFIMIDYHKDINYYLGVNALLFRHFGVVLNGFYNKYHVDHIHVDSSKLVGYRDSRSCNTFIQAICHYAFNIPTVIDGKFGAKTEKNILKVLDQLKIRNKSLHVKMDLKNNWKNILLAIAMHCFKKKKEVSEVKPIELNPLQKLHKLWELIPPLKNKELDSALREFSNDEKVQKFLKKYKDK